LTNVKNAEGSRVMIAVVQVWGVKIYVTAVEVLRKNRMKLSLPPPKLLEKLVLSLSYFVL
jgi:hypothetical protein